MRTPDLATLRRAPHWSYSSLNTFLNVCSLQWAFRHVYAAEPRFTPAGLAFGGVFHRCLEYLARLRRSGEDAAAGRALDLFSDLWGQECRIAAPPLRFGDGDADALDALGRSMLAAYVAGTDPGETVVAVALPFSAPLVDAAGRALKKPLIGEVDCVVESGGSVTLVDWKTAARRWPESKVRLDLQPTCYLYAHRRNGGGAAAFRFDVVTKTKAPAVERHLTARTEDHFARLVETVKVVDGMVRAEHFLPNDQGWACADCPYAAACAAWHRDRSRSLINLRLVA
ncbi:MAG: hypothetical protein A3K19_29765 [Lentisphaerae bacterium RIFOXYB12_FULL_65_16]|nr:MAG: hypothetical protein A3K18_33375 [Lentisphaerae bacterium RIFOXYA12_64_32]OGV86516.1 MAG: hypothetical protein A3K19_29765 [Lentisphaerae bacterium RIFOXYB12_FULL_65_16]